jgi:hypothetical protein
MEQCGIMQSFCSKGLGITVFYNHCVASLFEARFHLHNPFRGIIALNAIYTSVIIISIKTTKGKQFSCMDIKLYNCKYISFIESIQYSINVKAYVHVQILGSD